jgi:putative membrane protein
MAGLDAQLNVQSVDSQSSIPLKQPRPTLEPIEPHDFIASATMEFMTDMQSAELALARGTTESVRAIATHLIDDCNRVLSDVARVATRKNLPLPKSLDPDHEVVLQQMREKTGADFDAAYMERIASHHRHAMKLFKRGQAIKIPDISAFASRVLAMMEARIKLSRQLSGSMDTLSDGGLPHQGSCSGA